MSEGARAVILASGVLGAAVAWVAVRAARIPASSPERLVAELRLAQVAALLLVLTAGVYIGIAVANENRAGTGMDVALAFGFFVVAATVTARDPRQALTLVGLAFAAHALVDIAHRPDMLPDIVPRWYVLACAVYDLFIAALCYLPLLRR